MHRVLIDDINGGTARAGADEARHMKRVLRMAPGAAVELLDGVGGIYSAVLEEIPDGGAVFSALAALPSREPKLDITLYQGLSKPDHLTLSLQKCTELGVNRFVVFPMARSIAEAGRKSERWERIAREAAKQCGRGRVPEVVPVSFDAALALMRTQALLLMPWEMGGRPLREAAGAPQGDAGVVIGPEGGITGGEADAICAAGAVPVTLGARILRTETAGMAAVTALLLLSGDMDGAPAWP